MSTDAAYTMTRSQIHRMIENLVMYEEGGYNYSLVDKDRGGLTFAGLSENLLRQYSLYGLRAKQIPQDRVHNIYEREFIGPMNLDQMPEHVAVPLFSAGVNIGPHTAAKLWQRALSTTRDIDLAVDGVIGQLTLKATQKVARKQLSSQRVLAEFYRLWMHHYVDLVRRDLDQLGFLTGWTNRVFRHVVAPNYI